MSTMSGYGRPTCHSGLQAVSAIGLSIGTFLGPNQSAKCAIDDADPDNNAILTNAVDCLQFLDIEHPVGQLFNATCQSHHKRYGTSTTTLAAMAAFWSKAVIGLLDQGVPVMTMAETMSDMLEDCTAKAVEFSIAVEVGRGDVDETLTASSDLEDVRGVDDGIEGNRCTHAEKRDDQESEDFFEVEFEGTSGKTSADKEWKMGSHANDIIRNTPSLSHTVNALTLTAVPKPPKLPELPEIAMTSLKGERSYLVVSGDHSESDEGESDDDDDISWYFGGKMPSPPKFPEIPELSFLMESNTSVRRDRIGNHATHPEGPDGGRGGIVDITDREDRISTSKTSTMLTTHHCNNNTTAKTSNTADCQLHFHFERSISGTNSGAMSKETDICANDNDNDCHIASDEVGLAADDFDDDFENCFVEGHYEEGSVSQGKKTSSRSKHLQIGETDGERPSDISHHCQLVTRTETNDRPDVHFPLEASFTETDNKDFRPSEKQKLTSENLEKMLSEKMKVKSIERIKSVCNASRHFTSIQGIVDQQRDTDVANSTDIAQRTLEEADLRDKVYNREGQMSNLSESSSANVEKYSMQEEIIRIEEMLSNLEKVKDIRPSTLTGLQNNSRHFRTVESVVAEKKSEDPITSLNIISAKREIQNSVANEGKSSVGILEVGGFGNLSFGKLEAAERPSLTSIKNRSRHFRPQDDIPSSDSLDDGITVEDQRTGPAGMIKGNPTDSVGESVKVTDINKLGNALCHGKRQMMDLAIEAYKQQRQECKDRDKFTFDLNLINICCITGPSMTQCRLESGLVIEVASRYLQIIHSVAHREHHVLLINGDVKPSFRHTGYKESVLISLVQHPADTVVERSWLDDVIKILCEVGASIIMMRGTADDRLHDYCMTNEILLLENVKYTALQALSVAMDTNILTYITDASKVDCGKPVYVACWESGWQPKTGLKTTNLKRTGYIKLTTECHIQTLILCAPSTVLLAGLKYDFLNCAHRLQHAVTERKLLPGGGAIELKLIQYLQTVYGNGRIGEIHGYEGVIALALQNVFQEYLSTTMLNTGHDSNVAHIYHSIHQALQNDRPHAYILSNPESEDLTDMVCDCLGAKTAAWKAAWSLVKLILQCDMHIVTGIENKAGIRSWMHGDNLIGIL
ncbi:uncharacterized protein [Ptychodera flava]|uniref:uncharacterized protein n=1 Tax=Ptychodera flava TaxID=63121 RepID=UPI00396A7DE2